MLLIAHAGNEQNEFRSLQNHSFSNFTVTVTQKHDRRRMKPLGHVSECKQGISIQIHGSCMNLINLLKTCAHFKLGALPKVVMQHI